MAAGVMTAQNGGHRGWVSAAVSAVLHVVLLGVLAATSIHIASENRSLIPLVIREPAPPPPPPGAGAGAGPPAPVEPPKFVDRPKPIEAPKPVEKAKIAARPKPKQDVALPTPVTASPPTNEVASAPAAAGGDADSGAAGGVLGGVAGGKVGGRVGGRPGGSGDDVWSIDQVAVPPKLVDGAPPQYPPMARARGQEGVVVVQAIIDRRGTVESDSLEIVQSRPPFDAAALAAFRQWRFEPGRDDSGQAVRVRVRKPMRFQLR